MSGDGSGAGGPSFLRRVADHPRVPGPLRAWLVRLEASPLAYRLAHGAFWSVAGIAASRVLAIAASVFTARILGKQGYGEFGVLTSTLLTFQAFASLGLGLTATKYVAELRTREPDRAGRILAMTSVVSTSTGLLTTGLLWGIAPWLAAHTIGAPHLAGPLRIASFGLFFATLGGAQSGALAGFEAFRTMAMLNAWSGLIGVPIAVAAVWLWGLDGAVWGTVAAAAIQWLLTHVALRARARQDGIPISLRGWWSEQRILWTFSLPAMAQGVMVMPVTWAASAILVNQTRGYLEMGVLSAANQWFGAVLFLPGALGGAVLPVLAERVGQGDPVGARKVLRAAVALNAAAVAPVVLVASLASPWIMAMYGREFADTWSTLVVVLLTAGVVAVTNPVGYVLAASNRVWLGFLMNTGWATVFLGATWLLVGRGALGVAAARLIGYLVHSVWSAKFALDFVRKGKAAHPASTAAESPPA